MHKISGFKYAIILIENLSLSTNLLVVFKMIKWSKNRNYNFRKTNPEWGQNKSQDGVFRKHSRQRIENIWVSPVPASLFPCWIFILKVWMLTEMWFYDAANPDVHPMTINDHPTLRPLTVGLHHWLLQPSPLHRSPTHRSHRLTWDLGSAPGLKPPRC